MTSGTKVLAHTGSAGRAGVELERIEGLKRIQKALAGGIETIFQPILDLRNGALVGYESLARFSMPPRRTPDRWFAEAWSVGFGFELEVTALEESLRPAIAEERRFVSVNLSPATLLDPRFLLVLKTHPNLDRLVVEVTEHAVVEDYATLNRALAEIRALGVKVAVDDAGAGYSRLRHVLAIRPDFIKLDGSLVGGIDTDPSKRSVAIGMISSAHDIGAEIIAEAIERRAELDCLKSLGVNLGQGYHLGRPAPAAPGGEG